MKTIVFYISGHGFGHASRDVEVINALGAARADLRLIIRSAVSPILLDRTLCVPYELRAGACDTGVVQSTSVSHDDGATIREAIAFYRTLDVRADDEARALAGDGVQLIVGDIPPLAFEVASRLAVPSLAIANFTWDWIYEAYAGLADAAPWMLPMLRESYGRATLALELPFAGGFEVFREVRRIPLIARHATRPKRATRAALSLSIDRPLALLSFGGYGLPPLNLASLDCLETWSIVTTDRVDRVGGGALPMEVHQLSEVEFFGRGFRYPDLVGAADVVVTKPGYGIAAECIACGSSMLYTSRGRFREYDVFVRDLPKYLRCRFIEQETLFAGRWLNALNGLVQQARPPETMATNGAAVAASTMSSLVSG